MRSPVFSDDIQKLAEMINDDVRPEMAALRFEMGPRCHPRGDAHCQRLAVVSKPNLAQRIIADNRDV